MQVHLFAQCLVPTTDGDTLWPVIDRVKTLNAFGNMVNTHRRSIYASTQAGNMFYIGGDFTYVGPNSGAGVIMDEMATTVLSYKKWRINGPVYASISDGSGGYFIGGAFTKVGNTACSNLAHIDGQGVAYPWNPAINGPVKALALKNDTLIMGGDFTQVNGQKRNSFAMLNKNTSALLQTKDVSDLLDPGTEIKAFKVVDTFLYVGGQNQSYRLGSAFRVHLPSGRASKLPEIYQMEKVYTIDASEDGKRLYIGGHGGYPYNQHSNGYCMDIKTQNVLFTIGTSITAPPTDTYDWNSAILSIKVYGSQVFVGGTFNIASVGGVRTAANSILVFKDGSGQIQTNQLNCNGFVTSIHANGGKVYLGGEFISISGQERSNFALFGTLSKSIVPNTKSISDNVRTISFQGSSMFVGGEFHSIDGVKRDGFAAFDITTGKISSWTPNIYFSELTDMKAKGDTIFMAGYFGQAGNDRGMGGLAAVNAATGIYYTETPILQSKGNELLIDGNDLYIAGVQGNTGNTDLVKVYIPTLKQYGSWKPLPNFDVKSIQKKGNKIYAVGDNRRNGPYIIKGFVAEIDDSSGQKLRVFELSKNAGPDDLNWITKSCLIGDKLFITGLFNKINGKRRSDFAAISIKDGSLLPTNLELGGESSIHDMKSLNGQLYVSGSFPWVNGRSHKYFVVVDTALGIPLADRLHLNNDVVSPVGLPEENDHPTQIRLSSFHFVNNHLVLAGNFRMVDGNMFPSLVKLKMTRVGVRPPTPGIDGKDTVALSSQGNQYFISSRDSNVKYEWYYSGNDVTIRGNGTYAITLDIGASASPGQLKAMAINECGKSDTAYFDIFLRSITPTVNTTRLLVARKSSTTATLKFTKGNGAERIIVVKRALTIGALPQDGREYKADNQFLLGNNIGDSSFVVYRGNGDSVNLTNLDPAALYYVTAFEFNGSGSAVDYLIQNNEMISFYTEAPLPTAQASNISFTNNTVSTITITCSPGNGGKRLVVIRESMAVKNFPVDGQIYTANTAFGLGADIGGKTFVVSATSTPVVVTGLQPYTKYHVSVFEYNGNEHTAKYLLTNQPSAWFFTMAIEPTIQASNIVISGITGTKATINCTAGNGSGRLVVLREDSAVIDSPRDYTKYNFNSSFGLGSSIGNRSFVVRHSTPTDVILRPGRTYHVKIFEFNGADTLSDYLLEDAPSASFTTLITPPTLQASNLYFHSITQTSAYASTTGGNGSGRLIVLRADNPVIDVPKDGESYTPNSSFGAGDNIGGSSFVVKSYATVTNLLPGHTYYAKAFEYNGTGTDTKYLIDNAPTTSFTTLSSPYTVVSNFEAERNNGIVLQWTTEKEVNNKEFIVERSNDSINFSSIGVVSSLAPNGNSSASIDYSFIDNSAVTGTVFFRLKQIDKDAQFRYSAVIKVSNSAVRVGAINVTSVTSCGADFSATIAAISGTVNNINFEWGINNFTGNKKAAPELVVNSETEVGVQITGLVPATTYKLRLKYYVSGVALYSEEKTFTTNAAETPIITTSGPTTFCQGGSVTLSTAAANDYTYQWFRDGANVSGATTSEYTARLSGSYTVVVTNVKGCSISSAALQVTTSAGLATPTISLSGPAILCNGGNTLLSSSASSGNQWYKDSVLISGASASTYKPTSTGLYTVKITSGSCVSPVSNSIYIQVENSPAPILSTSGATVFCEGGSVTLSTTQNNAYTYQWYKADSIITGATQHSYLITSSGNYNVEVSNGNCSSKSQVSSIVVNPLPVRPTITLSGNTLISSALAGNQWYMNNSPIPGSNSRHYEVQDSGSYTVKVTEGGCTATSEAFIYQRVGNSDSSAWSSNISIFPNPVTDFLQIRNPDLLQINIMMVTASGNTVYQKISNQSAITINMGSLSAGIYWVIIKDPSTNETYNKLVLKL